MRLNISKLKSIELYLPFLNLIIAFPLVLVATTQEVKLEYLSKIKGKIIKNT